MRIRSGLLVFGLVSISSAAVLAACGSSSSSGDDSSVQPGNDGSTGTDTSTPTTVTANASDLSVYIGQNAVVAGSATPTSATFAWTITSAPGGSAITTASLTGASTATPSFTPDVVGDYKLSVVASAGGVTATATPTVHASAGKAFLGHEYDAGGGTLADEVLFMNADGTGRAAISCPTGNGVASTYISRGGLDWIEGDAGDPAIVAFPYEENTDAGTLFYVAAGTSNSRCGTANVAKLDVSDSGTVPQHARLSSSGQRVAYLRDNGSGLYAATIGVDGSDLRVFGAAFLGVDGGAGESGASATVPPTWVDDTQIAWIEIGNDLSSWSIKIARDQPAATINTFMTCNSAASPATSDGFFTFPAQAKIFEFNLLSDGTAIVATQLATVDAGNFVQLLVLSPDPTTHVCTFVRSFSAGSGFATDFSISPDKTKVAFLGSPSGNDNTYSLYVAPLSGSTLPVIVSGAPVQGIGGTGPRWAAAGHTIVWGQGAIVDGGSPSTVFAVPAVGGTAKPIAASDDPSESFFSVGNTCSVAFQNASPVAAFAMLGVFIGLIVRRRRNKK